MILDGVGVGGAPDASVYGDEGSDTLGNLASASGGLRLGNLEKLGLGNLSRIEGVGPVEAPLASFGRMEERGSGKDSITGHWELCGYVNLHPFPTYPQGFPDEIVDLVKRISNREVIGNEAVSGTEIMDRLGSEHLRSGSLILYTSADSVLQLLAHEEIVPLKELYRICREIHRELPPAHRVGRVIARPFVGSDGDFVRTPNRRDFAVEPPESTVLDILSESGIPVHGIGKVDTLFAGRGFNDCTHTKNNSEGISRIRERIESREAGLVFANLIDFDMQWGHRNDVEGFRKGLEELDAEIPTWLEAAKPEDLFIVTADHGNDPTTPSTDHSREHVPLLAWKGNGGSGKDLGVRSGFCDVAVTLAKFFGIDWDGPGISFLSDLPGGD